MAPTSSPLASVPLDGSRDGPSADQRGALPPGTELDGGRYRIRAPLGRGGFGITYEATDVRLRRTVAIKELFPGSARRDGSSVVVAGDGAASFARARQRFLREASTLARFGHPAIVRIYAVFEEHGTAYLVLERIEGRTLAAELAARGGPLTEAEALDVAVQLAGALVVVHRAGVLHRDVSPSNLIRTDDGRVVLIDFGLARPFDDHTMAMTRIVTPGYAPPEQHAGEARFTPRADVYAMGATVYRLLSGRVPPTPTRRISGSGDIEPLWRLNPTVSWEVSGAVDEALALDPADRPATVVAFLDRLGVDVAEAGLPLGAPAPAPADLDDRWEGDEGDDVDEIEVVDLADDVVARASEPAGRADQVEPRPRPADPATEVERAVEADLSWRPSMVVPRPSLASAVPTEPVRGASSPVVAVHRDPVLQPAAPERLAAPWAAPVHPPGRRWVALPLGLAAVSLASCQPVGVTLALGLVVGPALATVGDVVVRRDRHPAWAIGWWARNVVTGAGRLLGPLLVLAAGLGVWWVTDAVSFLGAGAPWVLRATGGTCGWMLASSLGRGSHRFRSDVAIDALTDRLTSRGRPNLQGVVLLVVCAALVAAGLWFQPEAWPLAG